MGENNRSLEEAFSDFIRDENSDEYRKEKTLEEVFQTTLDETTPELPGDIRDRKNREPVKKPDCWL
jgi:hypothetical protein